jgi:hypothetical protein
VFARLLIFTVIFSCIPGVVFVLQTGQISVIVSALPNFPSVSFLFCSETSTSSYSSHFNIILYMQIEL